MNLPEKKAAVFRAVLKLLRQGRPLGDLKVSEIAEAAGIGKGTVYEYFPSREELLRDAMQYSRAQGFQELYAAISDAEGFEARWKVIEITARQLLECSSVFFSQVPSMGFPQAALYDICGGPQERADTRRMIGEIMNCLTTAAVEEGLRAFHGAGRRFEKKGEFHGAMVYDDYAHHPHELQALLTTAAGLCIAIPALFFLSCFQGKVRRVADALNKAGNAALLADGGPGITVRAGAEPLQPGDIPRGGGTAEGASCPESPEPRGSAPEGREAPQCRDAAGEGLPDGGRSC